ncbi:MAG: FkbM family methyltransferase [Candidatus Hadarchaeaceae archaeon]
MTDRTGRSKLYRSEWPLLVATASLLPNRDRPAFQTYEVESTTIDEYLERKKCRLHFVKIDVEGVEDLVIEGMARTLEDCRPFILLEVHGVSDGSEHRALVLLRDAEYTLWALLGGGELKTVDTTYRGHVLAVRGALQK